MVSHTFRVPVLICCEAYKFNERVLLDSICSNELGDPDVISKVHGRNGLNDLENWSDHENLQLLNLFYDATPSDYVSMIVTEHGMCNCEGGIFKIFMGLLQRFAKAYVCCNPFIFAIGSTLSMQWVFTVARRNLHLSPSFMHFVVIFGSCSTSATDLIDTSVTDRYRLHVNHLAYEFEHPCALVHIRTFMCLKLPLPKSPIVISSRRLPRLGETTGDCNPTMLLECVWDLQKLLCFTCSVPCLLWLTCSSSLADFSVPHVRSLACLVCWPVLLPAADCFFRFSVCLGCCLFSSLAEPVQLLCFTCSVPCLSWLACSSSLADFSVPSEYLIENSTRIRSQSVFCQKGRVNSYDRVVSLSNGTTDSSNQCSSHLPRIWKRSIVFLRFRFAASTFSFSVFVNCHVLSFR
ncbi:hypothetical protein M5K25_019163 [Dendrobium thyrsiflorum]|uniref:Translation initiation factor eIF2B subunit delta n=1 Tax=Dendrobium thyrsiflorum TaxID=117978 RepID=A0ABD0UED5_DENTH